MIDVVPTLYDPLGVTPPGEVHGQTHMQFDGESFARTVPTAFTASESLDVGADLGSMVSEAHRTGRPFAFDGTIATMRVRLGE